MATVQTRWANDAALQEETWVLSLAEAKKVLGFLKPQSGSVWHTFVAMPYNRAIGAKRHEVKIYTEGFVSGEFSNILFRCNIAKTILPSLSH